MGVSLKFHLKRLLLILKYEPTQTDKYTETQKPYTQLYYNVQKSFKIFYYFSCFEEL